MKRRILCLALAVMLFALCFSGCGKYQKSNFIGKTAQEITAQYGEFDLKGPFITTDSNYTGYGYGYLLRESRVGFLGTEPAVYYFIEFENGVAVACYKGWHQNGG